MSRSIRVEVGAERAANDEYGAPFVCLESPNHDESMSPDRRVHGIAERRPPVMAIQTVDQRARQRCPFGVPNGRELPGSRVDRLFEGRLDRGLR